KAAEMVDRVIGIVIATSSSVKKGIIDIGNSIRDTLFDKTAQDPGQIRVPRIAELRMKAATGMYEVDVPLDTAEAYDRGKGIAWGTALQKSMEAKRGAWEQDRLSRAPANAPVDNKPTGGGPAGRAIHMTIKSAMDSDGGVATETMADRLRNVQTETWQRMEWVHDEAEMAWEAYNECLLLRSSSGNKNAQQEGGEAGAEAEEEGKGKEVTGVEGAPAAVVDDSGAANLVEKVSRLRTDWGELELLSAVSGVEVAEEGEQADAKGKGKGKEVAVKSEEQAARGGRGGGAASAAAHRRAARKGASKANAMEID
ncbi:hypothetical protein N0V88_008217, partial [Collariella sp. IMI 366227]